MMSVLMELIIAVQTELTLFAIAFGLHYVVFRGYKANRPKNLGKKFVSDEDSTADLQQSSHQPRPHLQQPSQDFNSATPEQLLQRSQRAFQQGDYRTVLRVWSSLKKHDNVPLAHFACVVESMQRLKNQDSGSILAEVATFFAVGQTSSTLIKSTICWILSPNPWTLNWSWVSLGRCLL